MIGDTVNTASRIEALTKEAPYPVLLSEHTTTSMRSKADDLVYVDEFTIRGKASRVRLWGLAGS